MALSQAKFALVRANPIPKSSQALGFSYQLVSSFPLSRPGCYNPTFPHIFYPKKFTPNCFISSNDYPSLHGTNINPITISIPTKISPYNLDQVTKNSKNSTSSQNNNVVEVVYSLIKSFGNLTKAAVTLVMVLSMAAMMMKSMFACDSALAFSGGRMGGHSSRSKSSYSGSNGRSSSGSSSCEYRNSYSSSCCSSDLSSYKKPEPEQEKPIPEPEQEKPIPELEQKVSLLTTIASIAFIILFGVGFYLMLEFIGSIHDESSGQKIYNVSKLQVAIYDTKGIFRRDLNRIAEKADTSKPSGLHHMLLETANLLLKHFDSCTSGYTSVHGKETMEFFDQLSLEERAKFSEETLLNVDNVKKVKVSSGKDHGLSKGYTVVTILVATCGSSNRLCTINNLGDLKKALETVQTIGLSELEAVEVLWAPQQQEETITDEELHANYPHLKLK